MYLNLDKPLAGFWLLLVWPALCLRRDGWSGIGGALAIAAAAAVVCLGLGVLLGKIAYAPKWPHLAWLWAFNNLLLVCLTEEALFRGYLQEALSRRFAERARGEVSAVGIAAGLFGIAHAAGDDGPIQSAEFVMGGQAFKAFNGGPHFTFSEGVSLYVDCEDQDEVDQFWKKFLEAGGTPTQCGWINDPFGLSWQIVSRRFVELMGDPDPKKVKAVMDAMLTTQKLDVAELERAYAAG